MVNILTSIALALIAKNVNNGDYEMKNSNPQKESPCAKEKQRMDEGENIGQYPQQDLYDQYRMCVEANQQYYDAY